MRIRQWPFVIRKVEVDTKGDIVRIIKPKWKSKNIKNVDKE